MEQDEHTISTNEFEKKQPIISTGNNEIDKRLGGGIPMGSLTLVEGQSDAGKSVLSQQLMWGSLHDLHKVVLFTTENSIKSLVTQMQSLGLDILDQLLMGWIKIYTLEATKTDPATIFDKLLDAMESLEQYQLFVVDSLTPLVAYSSLEDTLSYFERCRRLCDKEKTIINISHSFAFNEEILIRIRSICDAHLRLSIEEVGDKLLKTLEVGKIRGADKGTGNIISFDVEPGIGMKILPLSKAKV
jgi:flagellar protein FlaH